MCYVKFDVAQGGIFFKNIMYRILLLQVTAAGVESVAGVLEQLADIPGSGEAVAGIASNLMTVDESALTHRSKNRYSCV